MVSPSGVSRDALLFSEYFHCSHGRHTTESQLLTDMLMTSILREPPRHLSCWYTLFDNHRRNNYSFRCHRRDQMPNTKDQSLIFGVNDISFHPVHGTFSTCGIRCQSYLQFISDLHILLQVPMAPSTSGTKTLACV